MTRGLESLLLDIKLTRGATVVDLGAGDAPYRPLFEARGLRYVCCDLPGEGAEVEITPGEKTALPDGCADVVVSFQVLEHVWNTSGYLQESRRLLKPTGLLVLSTHGVWPYHPHPADYRRWTRQGLLAEMAAHGFEADSVLGLVGPLAWTTLLRFGGYRHVLRHAPLVGPPLCALAGLAVYLRMKCEDLLTPAQWIQNNASIYLVVARPRAAR